MSIELIQKAKKLVNDYKEQCNSHNIILTDYGIEVIEWITEQAERVQELEEQNKRYREALSIISANLPLDGREHYVDIARKALEGDSDE